MDVKTLDAERTDGTYGHYFFLDKKTGYIVRVDRASCLAVAENTACEFFYGRPSCVGTIGLFKWLYESKDPILDVAKCQKKWQPAVRKFLSR